MTKINDIQIWNKLMTYDWNLMIIYQYITYMTNFWFSLKYNTWKTFYFSDKKNQNLSTLMFIISIYIIYINDKVIIHISNKIMIHINNKIIFQIIIFNDDDIFKSIKISSAFNLIFLIIFCFLMKWKFDFFYLQFFAFYCINIWKFF